MARRGFFAELQHQSRVAAREREKRDKQATQHHLATVRFEEQARKAEERAISQLAKISEAERKRLEKEARDARVAAKEAEVIERNSQLEAIYEDLESLLSSSLAVDDFVDLTSLRSTAKYPPFDRRDLEIPLPSPKPIQDPAEPRLILPTQPSGIFGIFGKKKFSESVETVRNAHKQALVDWHAKCEYFKSCRQAAEKARDLEEAQRLEALRLERQRYAHECAKREEEANELNKDLDDLIANLGYGTVDAVQEYVSIVLANSVYPNHFKVHHEFEFDPATAELRLQAVVPGPNDLPNIKAYKYTKSTDEISSISLSQKECRDRYAHAIHQVALRSFHEIFEADRRGLIQTISLEVGTNAVDPAVGHKVYVPLVIAGAERKQFLSFDLSSVIPNLTLGRMGAALSKNPFGLVPTERQGVRRS